MQPSSLGAAAHLNRISGFSTRVLFLIALLIGLATSAKADVIVLLEEPYSYDGALAGTGHTAVYLSRVCADSPVVLRRCLPGERGVVISRYTRIGGYDWLAIPLIPYLYAVEKPEDVPLYADAKVVAFLRDRYRRSYLEDVAPDGPNGGTPKGDWVQLIGSSYDRTSYGFQIETTPVQDDALIEWFNSRPNRVSYNAVSRNCANFVRDVVDFYYPGAISHGFITDLEVTTPKHAAKSLVRYSEHHSDLKLRRIVFPQVPGTMKRSRPVRGVLESVVRAKKYVLPFAVFHPFVAGAVVSVYFFGDRFNPAQNAMVFDLNANGGADVALPAAERKTYIRSLEAGTPSNLDRDAGRDIADWHQFQQTADFEVDDFGHLIATGHIGDEDVEMGISRDDLLRDDLLHDDATSDLQRGLLLARLHQELSRGRAPKISSSQFHEDWRLWRKANRAEREEASRHLAIGN